MSASWEKVTFGRTGLQTSPIGIGSSYGVTGADLERAHERGINFFFYGLRRRGDYGRGLKRIAAKDRDGIVIAAQSYTRVAGLMEFSLDRVLSTLEVDSVDLLGLGWWNDLPPARILDAARELKRKGKVKHLLISSHHRPSFLPMMELPDMDGIMIRYNAGHPGAEREVFEHLPENSPGVLAFTATRWGSLMDPKLTPSGEPTPRASDCYRFVLSNPHVHATLIGPKDTAEMDEALTALDRGPLDAEEMAWMRRVGAVVRGDEKAHRAMGLIDRVRDALFGRKDRKLPSKVESGSGPSKGELSARV